MATAITGTFQILIQFNILFRSLMYNTLFLRVFIFQNLLLRIKLDLYWEKSKLNVESLTIAYFKTVLARTKE